MLYKLIIVPPSCTMYLYEVCSMFSTPLMMASSEIEGWLRVLKLSMAIRKRGNFKESNLPPKLVLETLNMAPI